MEDSSGQEKPNNAYGPVIRREIRRFLELGAEAGVDDLYKALLGMNEGLALYIRRKAIEMAPDDSLLREELARYALEVAISQERQQLIMSLVLDIA